MTNSIEQELEIIGSLLSSSGKTFHGEISNRKQNGKFARIDLVNDLSNHEIENRLKNVPFIPHLNSGRLAVKLGDGLHNSALIDEGLLLIINKMPNAHTVVWLMTDEYLNTQLSAVAKVNNFPQSEIRLVKQLVSGLSLAQAAKTDNLGYETKKGYFKNITSKLHVNSQTQLVSKTILHLVEVIDSAIRKFDSADTAGYLKRIHKDARLYGIQDEYGHDGWILDYGPTSKQPVIWFAQQALTPFSNEELEVLQTFGLRVLIPVRPGSLQPEQEKLSDQEYDRRIQFAARQAMILSGRDKVDVAGIISGGMFAIEFCEQFPDNINSLLLYGAYGGSKKPTGISALFRNAAMTITSKSPVISEQLFNLLARKLKNPDQAKKFFLKLYRDSKPDVEFIEKEFSSTKSDTSLLEVFINSKKSVEMDFQKLHNFDWKRLANISAPKMLIHGELDSLFDEEACRHFAETSNSELYIMPECGQLAFGHHFKNMMSAWISFQQKP